MFVEHQPREGVNIDVPDWHPFGRDIVQPAVWTVAPITLRGAVTLDSEITAISIFSALFHNPVHVWELLWLFSASFSAQGYWTKVVESLTARAGLDRHGL